jgi:ABC-2 type transport system permease protein
MRLAWAFFKRDAAIALSYRISFAAHLLGNLFMLAAFYYIGRTVGVDQFPALAPYGGNLLAFLLIGIALADCVMVSMVIFANQIREAMVTGTLEASLMSQVKLSTILLYSSLWSYFFTTVRFVLFLVMGVFLYGLSWRNANVLSAVVVFLLTVFCFVGMGILWASVVMLVKRGDAVVTSAQWLFVFLGGVLFPVSSLPSWLQQISALVPLTPALEGLRFALLRNSSLVDLSPVVLKLLLFAIALMSAGLFSFNRAVESAKQSGSLAEY